MNLSAVYMLPKVKSVFRYLVCSFDGTERSSVSSLCDFETNNLREALNTCMYQSKEYEVSFVYDCVNKVISHVATTEELSTAKEIPYDLITSYLKETTHSDDDYRIGYLGYEDHFKKEFKPSTAIETIPHLGITIIKHRGWDSVIENHVTTFQILEVGV